MKRSRSPSISIWAVPFDLGKRRVLGEPYLVASGAVRAGRGRAVNSAQDPPLGTVTKLFDVGTLGATRGQGYDASPDGSRFIFSRVATSAAESTRRLVLVENWRSEFAKQRGCG